MPTSVLPFSTLLLSGGASSRFGGRPKALLSIAGQPAIRRMAEIAGAFGSRPVLAIVRPGSQRILAALQGIEVEPVVSERCTSGRTASIQAGLAALPPGQDVLLWPVDHSFVEAKTLRALDAARRSDTMGRWFTPTYEGRGGHPVLLTGGLRREVATLGPDEPLRTLRGRLALEVVRVPVLDPGVVSTIDTPAAYRAASGQEVQWIES